MRYSLSNNQLRIGVNSLGAELCSVQAEADGLEYIWQADADLWARHAPHLFPIVGRLKDNRYTYRDQEYTLPQHGFARDMEFVCIGQAADTLTFELCATEETLKAFPFHFSLQISYTLKEDTLTVSYLVFNPANEALLFSLGAHPAFNCPLQAEESFGDYELQFNGLNVLTVSKLHEGLIADETKPLHLSDHKLHLQASLFDKDALVMKHGQIREVRLSSTQSGRGVELHGEHWPYFGIWTKAGSSKFLCLEPWHGIADAEQASGRLEDKEGMIHLAPEESFHAAFTLKFL